MRVKFWGVRGSVACPGPKTVKYGGNTPCLELQIEGIDRSIIIDAGSGIRELGNSMMRHGLPNGPTPTEIFLTHTHWDHIMGFPFFNPIYEPDFRLQVYGPISFENDTLEEVVGGQLSYRYFPVRQAELSAQIEYIQLKEGRLELGDGITVITKFLNHTILCLGYRFEYKDKVFCTAYDTEPFRNLFSTSPTDSVYDDAMAKEGELTAKEQNKAIENFISGADLLVHDSQYTQKEYESSKIGWGHSFFEHVCATADRAGVKALALFHHEPIRTDEQIDELAKIYCALGGNGKTEIFFAREGMEVTI